MARVLILGGTGLIGTHLTLRLLRDGHRVTCADLRDPADSPLLERIVDNPRFGYICHNAVNPLYVECDMIYNLASPSYLHHDTSQPYTIMRTNIIGSMHMLELARANRARLLFASSGDIYLPRNGIASLERHRGDGFYSTLSEAKRSAEALHRAHIGQYGTDARVARIFNTYGSGAQTDDGRAVMKMIRAALQNRDIEIDGGGDQIRTFCWVGDTVEALVKFMELAPSQTPFALNIGGQHEVTIRQLAATIVRITGSHSRIVAGNPRNDDMRRKVPDLQLTHRITGWLPQVALSEGLQRTVRYVERLTDRERIESLTWAETL